MWGFPAQVGLGGLFVPVNTPHVGIWKTPVHVEVRV